MVTFFKKKSVMIVISVLLCCGVVVGAVFGGIAISDAIKEIGYQKLQGYDTSLKWVNINNMLAEPVLIEENEYDYSQYVVEVPNTTALCVQSYEVGKAATAAFYYDEACENAVSDIKMITLADDEYSKTLYIKIAAAKGDERVVKLDITVDDFLVNGTTRKENLEGHIEIPADVDEVVCDDITYKVVWQSNSEDLAEITDYPSFILAEDITVYSTIENEMIEILNGNNYSIITDENSVYNNKFDINNKELELEKVFSCLNNIKNLKYIGLASRLVYLTEDNDNMEQIKAINGSLAFVNGSTDWDMAKPIYTVKNCLIEQSEGSNYGVVTQIRTSLLFNCINYTTTDAEIQSYFTIYDEDTAEEDRYKYTVKISGGVTTFAKNSQIINCYNFLSIKSDNSAGGIVGGVRGANIVHCNNYGNIEAESEYYQSTISIVTITATSIKTMLNGKQHIGGILAELSLQNEGNDLDCIASVSDCTNYGDISYDENCYTYDQIFSSFASSRYNVINCNSYGRKPKKIRG